MQDPRIEEVRAIVRSLVAVQGTLAGLQAQIDMCRNEITHIENAASRLAVAEPTEEGGDDEQA